MGDSELRSKLCELLGALTNREITPEQHRELDQLLAESKRAREIYLDYMDLDFELRELHAADDIPKALLSLQQLVELETVPAAHAGTGRHWLGYVAVAAATLCAAILVHFLLISGSGPDRSQARTDWDQPGRGEEGHYVATVVRMADCAWEGNQAGMPEGWRLAPGALRLQQGVAMIRFDGGIELVAEGPCHLEIESGRSARLTSGKVVLRGDDITESFEMRTAVATLVDLGTEYAIEVDDAGTTEVHVFAGVVVKESSSTRIPAAERIRAGEARRYLAGSQVGGQDVPLSLDRFIREVAVKPRGGDEVRASLLAYEPFDYPEVELPSEQTIESGFGWSAPWYSPPNRPAVSVGPDGGLHADALRTEPNGGAIDHQGSGQIRRALEKPIRLDRNGVCFLSYLFHSSGTEGGDKLRLTLCNSEATEASEGWMRLHFGKYKSDYLFGYLAGRRFTTRLPLDKRATYLLVAKIVASVDGPDQTFATVYRSDGPVDAEEPASWSMVSPPIRTDLVLNEVWVSLGGDVRQQIDEIRLGGTWASVTQPFRTLGAE
jgi:hypothetical protein